MVRKDDEKRMRITKSRRIGLTHGWAQTKREGMNPKTEKKNENCAVLREQQTVLSNLIEIPEFDRRISNIEYRV